MPANGTVLMLCNCVHAYQDARYGKHVRVHNKTGGKQDGKATCSVCGTKKYLPSR